MSPRKMVNATREQTRARRGKPKLGQHFLRDRAAAQRIVEALDDVQQRTVVEIGPGQGVLTELLVSRAAHVIAVELDRVLAAQLSLKFSRLGNVEIVEANILDVSLAGLLRRRTQPLAGFIPGQAPVRVDVLGNLPYYITSDILLHLFAQHELIERIVIMVQKEVGDRLAAKPSSSAYGLLSATAQLYARVEKLFDLPPAAFAPPPKVHSSVLRLTIAPRWQELAIESQPFIEFLKLSFGRKRKTLVNNLRARFTDEKVRAALRAAGMRSDARAEAISLEKMAAIFRALQA